MSEAGAVAQVASRAVESMTFEELVVELESVAQSMDSGAIGIEAATNLYARASALHSAATQRLADVTARIDQLRGPVS